MYVPRYYLIDDTVYSIIGATYVWNKPCDQRASGSGELLLLGSITMYSYGSVDIE